MNRLFAYGTLCPDRENAHILGNIGGEWQKASVNGVVHTLDWGPDQGLPALVLEENAPKVSGLVFSTDKLAEHWPMLDEFEGFQYQRVKVMVEFETGEMIESWTYQMNPHAKLMQLESERT